MTALTLCVLLVFSAPALAYHRQTAPIVAITDDGDTALPRVPAHGHRLALALEGSGNQIFRLDRGDNLLEPITITGDNDNPTISSNGSVLAWDADCDLAGCPDPGRQIFLWTRGDVVQVTEDPTGTSTNPALSGNGSRLAFESTGNLTGQNPTGARQVFLRLKTGDITQVSSGQGASRNPVLTRLGLLVVYDSTSSPAGANTGIAQIWLAPRSEPAAPITTGLGPSQAPAVSADGRFVVFESTADLTGDQQDTGVSQIFAYEPRKLTLSQLTNDPVGCTGASVYKVPGDWRVAFVCHDRVFFRELQTAQTYRLPITTGDTPRAIAELGIHFMVVSTTANLMGTGTTPGHQIYMLNLFRLAPEPVASTWP
jgi:Tol biopolymer transport system component